MHQRLPILFIRLGRRRFGARLRDQQALHGAPGRHAAPEQARRKHTRVVDHQQIAAAKQVGEGDEGGMRDSAGITAQTEQPAGAPFRRRLLGDELGRKIEIELADVHPQ